MERILQLVLALNGSLHPCDGWILVGTHVHDVVVALILNRATGVVSLDGIVAVHEGLARTSLVTQTPDHHGRMIDCSVNHLHVSCDVGVAELRNVRQTLLAIVILMALDVCLVLQVDSVLVAEIIPVWSIWIVAVAHVVDVATLHQQYLMLHLFAAHGVACLDIVLMTVHTLQLDRLTVQIIVSSRQSELVLFCRSFLDFHLSETNEGRECLHGSALSVLQLAHQCVAMRRFCTPEVHLVGSIQRSFKTDFSLCVQLACELSRCGYTAEQGVLVRIKTVGIERILDSVALDSLLR